MGLISEPVGTALDGLRLDRAVALAAGVSRATAARLLRDGCVLLDGRVVTSPARRVSAGQSLTVDHEAPVAPRPTADRNVALEVVYEDRDVIVVDKPPGLVVHPGAGNEHETLVNGLLARYPELADVGDPQRPGIVHRLDRGTSGLLVVARSNTAHQSLIEQLKKRQVQREYSCLVWGHPEASSGIVEAPVGRSRRNPTRMTVTERGRPARTCYEVEQRYCEPATVSLLACRLVTGRTHQIRVHLQVIGHPVVGDTTYGTAGTAITAVRRGKAGPNTGAGRGTPARQLRCLRPFLHARSLTFRHPTNGTTVQATAALPQDLAAVLGSLS